LHYHYHNKSKNRRNPFSAVFALGSLKEDIVDSFSALIGAEINT